MSLNKESNGYIVFFTIMMVVAVSFLLVGVQSGLLEKQQVNEANYTRSSILAAVMNTENINVGETYLNKIKEVAIDHQGNVVDDVDVFEINKKLKNLYKMPETERVYPLFVFSQEDGSMSYIVPLTGMGLWDRIYGYVAINEDLETIEGASFGHVAETPGLGAEIESDKFVSQFNEGKKVFNEEGQYAFEIFKAGKYDKNKHGIFGADGLSGATITTVGADDMLKNCITNYKPYFESLNSGRASL